MKTKLKIEVLRGDSKSFPFDSPNYIRLCVSFKARDGKHHVLESAVIDTSNEFAYLALAVALKQMGTTIVTLA